VTQLRISRITGNLGTRTHFTGIVNQALRLQRISEPLVFFEASQQTQSILMVEFTTVRVTRTGRAYFIYQREYLHQAAAGLC